MNCYASSYISGLGNEIEKWLKQIYSDCQIVYNFDGLIVYKTSQKQLNLSFFNNTFLVLAYAKCSGGELNKDILTFVNNINIDFAKIREFQQVKGTTFKILTYDKNQPSQIDYKNLKPIEKSIEKETGLKLGERKHDVDFVLSRRSENIILFMLKLTYQRKTEKDLGKGSLRPELAYILAKIADIKDTDVCMDMFCGSGAIPKQIIKNFTYNMIFASDIDEVKILKLKKEYKGNNKKLYIKQRDALNLDYFKDGFIDKIITDPPWNEYNSTGENFTEFYISSLTEISRLLKDDGKAVILMGNIKEFEQALNMVKTLTATQVFNILVNGKKANIYVLIKKTPD